MNTKWPANAPSEKRNSRNGSANTTSPESPPLSADSLLHALASLVQEMREQNHALWALVDETAAMIEILAETEAAEDDDEPTTYLDGTRR